MKKLLLVLAIVLLSSCGDDIMGQIIVKGVELNEVEGRQEFRYRVTLDGNLLGRETTFYTNTNYKVGDTIK